MVRALLAGTKTQTRRAVKYAAPDLVDADGWPLRDLSECGAGEVRAGCPYGVPGDRIWAREAWRVSAPNNDKPPRDVHPCDVHYEADDGKTWPAYSGRLRASMHMPRWASRITLEITGVRVERLQDISDADAVAEGIGLNEHATGVQCTIPAGMSMPRAFYRALWEDINGAGSWDANPWVWVVEFRRV